MTKLVTLDQAKAHLRVDHDADDDDIELKLQAASACVLDYLKEAVWLAFVDSTGEVIADVPWQVQAATLLLLGSFYSHRGEDGGRESQFQMGFLPPAVTALLYPLRTPTVV